MALRSNLSHIEMCVHTLLTSPEFPMLFRLRQHLLACYMMPHTFYHTRAKGGFFVKVHRMPKGVVLVGKAWEIRAKLKEYGSILF